MSRYLPAVALALPLLAGPAFADAPAQPTQAAKAADATSASPLAHVQFKLDNGLDVILQEDHSQPLVAVSVWYHVGAFDEPVGRSGFAHLFEHLMFQGTPHVGDDKHIAYLEQAGASALNGTTNFDRTNYFEVVPSSELELALWLESDRMGWLMEGMSQAKLDEQRDVVKNERLQRVDNVPYGLAEEKLWQTIFPEGHPYRGMIIGSLEELDKASLTDVADFFGTYYAPSNATLSIVGDVTEAQARALVQKYFGTLPVGARPERPTHTVPTITAEKRVAHTETFGKFTKVHIAYVTPALYAPGDAELDVLSHALTGTDNARLTRALTIDHEYVQSVHAYQQSLGHASLFQIEAVVRDGVDADTVIAAIDEVLMGIYSKPITKAEIDRAVNELETGRMFALQAVGGFGGRAEQLQSYNHFRGKPDLLEWDLNRYRTLTPESVFTVLTTSLNAEQRVVLVATPASAEKSAAPAAGDQP